MLRPFKTKLLIIVSVLVFFLYFIGDFSLIDIQKTAIIVALGVDKDEQGFLVTAQIAVPQVTETQAQNNDALLSSSGKTVVEAIDNIGITTGWQPKLSFCDLIMLGEDVVAEDISYVIDHILASQRLQNSALLATCKGKASEVLNKATALDAISSFAIQKILLKNTLKVNTVLKSTVREFAMMHYSPSNTAYMPIITAEPSPSEKESDSSSSQMAAATSGGSGEQSGEKQSENVIFNATKTAVFVGGKHVLTMEKDETLAFNLLKRTVEESVLPITADDHQILLAITKNSHSIKLRFENKPTVFVNLKLSVSVTDGTNHIFAKDVKNVAEVPVKYLQIAEQSLTDTLNRLNEKLAKANCDLFEAKNVCYKYNNKQFDKIKNLSQEHFAFSPHVKVVSLD